MKDRIIRIAASAMRAYIQFFPLDWGKVSLWNHIICKYISWRRMPVQARTTDGVVLSGAFPDSLHTYIYFFGVWEPNVTAYIRSALNPGDIFIDVGANAGVHSLLASRLVGDTGRVHAVEASPSLVKTLRANIAANGATNVTVYPLAASDKAGPVSVFLHDPSNLGGTTVVASEASLLHASFEQEVPGRRLPDIVPPDELCQARLIKIDVEGAEWLVVQGLRELLPTLRPDAEFLVEVNVRALQSFGASLEQFLAIFSKAGFAPFEIANSYSPQFYLEPIAKPVPLRRPMEFGDLLFRRAT